LQQTVTSQSWLVPVTFASLAGGDTRSVPPAAPRIDARLIAAIARIDERTRPIAETWRRVGVVADNLELSRPSYEQVRVIVHLIRGDGRSPGVGELLLAAAVSTQSKKPILDLIDALS
jgi:hypothetical protein